MAPSDADAPHGTLASGVDGAARPGVAIAPSCIAFARWHIFYTWLPRNSTYYPFYSSYCWFFLPAAISSPLLLFYAFSFEDNYFIGFLIWQAKASEVNTRQQITFFRRLIPIVSA
jgi:hypothetical protein